MKYYKAIVVYNKYISESASCNSLKGHENVIVYDNSQEKYLKKNKLQSEENGYEYITNGENVGLSRAYNSIIEIIQKKENEFYISWFDDDTTIPESYFEEMEQWVQKEKFDLLLPVVIDNGGVLSPSYIWAGFYPRRIKKIENIKGNITAINSGLCVSWRVYKKVKYDENLFLDYVDHVFVNDAKREGFSLKVVNAVINQSFSETLARNKKQVESRFAIYAKDFSNAYHSPLAKMFLMIRGARRSVKYRTVSFIKMVWRNIK